jgi:hypothetical protein
MENLQGKGRDAPAAALIAAKWASTGELRQRRGGGEEGGGAQGEGASKSLQIQSYSECET